MLIRSTHHKDVPPDRSPPPRTQHIQLLHSIRIILHPWSLFPLPSPPLQLQYTSVGLSQDSWSDSDSSCNLLSGVAMATSSSPSHSLFDDPIYDGGPPQDTGQVRTRRRLTYMHTLIQAHSHTSTLIQAHSHTSTLIQAHSHTSTHTYKHTHTSTLTYKHTHI